MSSCTGPRGAFGRTSTLEMMPDDKDREIGRFNDRLDRLIGGGGEEEGDIEGRIAAATKLAAMDFSEASGVRESLRARLLERDEGGPFSRLRHALTGARAGGNGRRAYRGRNGIRRGG